MAEHTRSLKYLTHDDRQIAKDKGPFKIDKEHLENYFKEWLSGDYDYFEATELVEGEGAIITIERTTEPRLSYVHIVMPNSHDLYAKHKIETDEFVNTMIGQMPQHFFLNDSEVARVFDCYINYGDQLSDFDWVKEESVFCHLR